MTARRRKALILLHVILVLLESCRYDMSGFLDPESGAPPSDSNWIVGEKADLLFRSLTDEDELNELALAGEEATEIVDWRISRQFAVLRLADSIDAGEFSGNCALSSLPLPVYSPDGSIEAYEFCVINAGRIVGRIGAAATKRFACPVLSESATDMFEEELADAIALLESDGEEASCLGESRYRLVGNGYPNLALARIEGKDKTGLMRFEAFVDIRRKAMIGKDGLASVVECLDFAAAHPEMALPGLGALDAKSIRDGQSAESERFWGFVKEHEGSIMEMSSTRALSSKSKAPVLPKRTAIDKDRIYNAFHVNGRYWHVANYGACAAVSAGFILDYLQANLTVFEDWRRLGGLAEKKRILYDVMRIGDSIVTDVVDAIGEDGGSVTMPADIGNAISLFSRYELRQTSGACPEKSIENNLPGISLRLLNSGAMHYRNVIACKETGWGPFSWVSFKILDLVDCQDVRRGSWETFIPVYHAMCWDVVRK